MKFYIPSNIDKTYKYIVPNSNGGYYDLYNTDTLIPGQYYYYYRFYYDLDSDLYTEHTRNPTGVANVKLNAIQIEPTYSYWARRDYPDIVVTSAIIIIGLVALFNIITSLIKKGGLLSGLL